MARRRDKDAVVAKAPRTTRINCRIDTAAARRLHVHCALEQTTPGAVITALIDHLPQYRVQTLAAGKSDPAERNNCSDSTPPPALKV